MGEILAHDLQLLSNLMSLSPGSQYYSTTSVFSTATASISAAEAVKGVTNFKQQP